MLLLFPKSSTGEGSFPSWSGAQCGLKTTGCPGVALNQYTLQPSPSSANATHFGGCAGVLAEWELQASGGCSSSKGSAPWVWSASWLNQTEWEFCN